MHKAKYRSARSFIYSIIVSLIVLSGSVWAEVTLNPLFTDNMVLQRGIKVKVWGTAEAGEKVTAAICGQTATATADAAGKWKLELAPLKAGCPFEMTVTGVVGDKSAAKTLKNVAVGDVWICSGQSNMEFGMRGVKNAQEEIAAANYPMIRHFAVRKNVQDTVVDTVTADGNGWKVCTPQEAGGFTAVGYFFGRDLHKTLNIPIGLIHTSWGGSFAESWTTRATLLSDPDFKPTLERSQAQLLSYAQEICKVADVVKTWAVEAEKAKADGKDIAPMPVVPELPRNPLANWEFATSRYNAMIAPLIDYAITGAIWYQGESNAGRAWQYRKLLPAMIADWRKAWGQGDFPFYIVQLANFMDARNEPCEADWAELREAESMTAKNVPNCGLAVIIDIGEARDIHPKNKQDVGGRLALAALAQTYGEKIVYSGPEYESMKVDGSQIILKFKHVGGGLVAKDGDLKQFAIAGEDKKFVWADAKITGNTVVVSSDKVAAPVAVRYAWQANPEGCNLYNKEGLPASPFRTDDWQLITFDRK